MGKLIVATSFEWLPKVQIIAKSGHTDHEPQSAFIFVLSLSSKSKFLPPYTFLSVFFILDFRIPLIANYTLAPSHPPPVLPPHLRQVRAHRLFEQVVRNIFLDPILA